MTKNQRKVKTRSFEMSKNLVPKDMGNKASPQEEATGSTPLAKATQVLANAQSVASLIKFD
jgi:hypothetical protein